MQKTRTLVAVSVFLAGISALALIFLALGDRLPVLATETPKEIAGIKLGENIESAKELIRMDTMLPVRFSPFIREVETVAIPGFEYGLLWIGDCEEPGRILRIKMKYENPSKKFYDEMLERLKERYGEPKEWRGDPFHAHLAWKWSFVDKQGNDVSMILEHNVRDPDETTGNSLKLTMWNLVEKEKVCYKSKTPKRKPKVSTLPDWEMVMPK